MQFSTNISRPGMVNIFKNTPYRPCQTVTYEVNYSDRNLIFRNCFILRLKSTVDGPTLSAVKKTTADTTAGYVGPCAFSNKCVIKLSLKIPMPFKRVTTLPCEIFGTLWHSVVFASPRNFSEWFHNSVIDLLSPYHFKLTVSVFFVLFITVSGSICILLQKRSGVPWLIWPLRHLAVL